MIMFEEEKRGVLPFRLGEGLDFISFVARAGVQDTEFLGSKYMWCNNSGGQARIWKSLDRMPYNQHLGSDLSNDAPLLLAAASRLDNKPRSFHFLNVWTTRLELLKAIRCN